MNIKEVKALVNLMNENNLTEVEVEQEGMHIRLKKGSTDVNLNDLQNKVGLLHPIQPLPHPTAAPLAQSQEAAKPKSTKSAEIKAPMVGTFYRASSPESPPFAEINAEVQVGQVICIIEAMKLMNEIKSEVRGKIIDILVDNAEPVEFGQPLFLIEPL